MKYWRNHWSGQHALGSGMMLSWKMNLIFSGNPRQRLAMRLCTFLRPQQDCGFWRLNLGRLPGNYRYRSSWDCQTGFGYKMDGHEA